MNKTETKKRIREQLLALKKIDVRSLILKNDTRELLKETKKIDYPSVEEYFKQFREDLDMSKEDYGGMELEMAFWLWGKRVGFTTYVKDTKILLNKSQLRYDLIATGKLGAKLSCSFEFGDLQDVTLSGFVNGLYK